MAKQLEIKASTESYGSALMLNNMAVCFLQKGFLNEALKTINESLCVFKHSFSLVGNTDPEIASSRIARATLRLAKTYGKQKPYVFEVTEVADNDFASLQAAAKYGPSSSVFFPMRISLEKPTCEQEAAEIARQFAIVLYNQGIIQFLSALSSPHGEENESEKLRRYAMRSLEFSVGALSRDEKDSSPSSRDDTLAMLLLKTLVLNSLSQVYFERNLETKLEGARSCVVSLSVMVEDFNQMSRLGISGEQTSAAPRDSLMSQHVILC